MIIVYSDLVLGAAVKKMQIQLFLISAQDELQIFGGRRITRSL
jgi:hypothetical protein